MRRCDYCGSEYSLMDKSPDNRKRCYECVPMGDIKAARKKCPSRVIYDKNRIIELKKRREYFKTIISEKKDKCCICGYDRCKAALHFHHKRPEDKKELISMINKFANIEQLIEEMDKCVVLCANCHTEVHYFKYDMDRYE